MAANQNVLQLTQQTGSAASTSVIYAVTGGTTDTGLPLSVLFNNPAFTGIPTTTTAAVDTNTTQIASTAYVINQGYLKATTAGSTYAPLASPTFTGTVVIPTVTLSGGTINGTTLGITTPAAAKVTTLAATGLITPTSTIGIAGTVATDNAAAGSVGEYITASVTTPAAITIATVTNLTSISLTAGDWDVTGNAAYVTGTTGTQAICGINTVTATNPGLPFQAQNAFSLTTGQLFTQIAPTVRLSLAVTTTVFLVGFLSGSGSPTYTAYIRARRVR